MQENSRSFLFFNELFLIAKSNIKDQEDTSLQFLEQRRLTENDTKARWKNPSSVNTPVWLENFSKKFSVKAASLSLKLRNPLSVNTQF